MTNATFKVGDKVVRTFANKKMAAGSIWTVSWVSKTGSAIKLKEQEPSSFTWNVARFTLWKAAGEKPAPAPKGPKFKPGDVVVRVKPHLYAPSSMPVGSTWIVESFDEDGDPNGGTLRFVGKLGSWSAHAYEHAEGYVAPPPPPPVKKVVYNKQKVTA